MELKPIKKEELDRLADYCCMVFGVNIDDFYSNSRRRNVTDARKAYYHIAKHYYKINELEMSLKLPLGHHRTTIMFSVDCADDLLSYDKIYSGKYSVVYKLFNGFEYDKSKQLNRRSVKLMNYSS